jgi:hypothetical protein
MKIKEVVLTMTRETEAREKTCNKIELRFTKGHKFEVRKPWI